MVNDFSRLESSGLINIEQYYLFAILFTNTKYIQLYPSKYVNNDSTGIDRYNPHSNCVKFIDSVINHTYAAAADTDSDAYSSFGNLKFVTQEYLTMLILSLANKQSKAKFAAIMISTSLFDTLSGYQRGGISIELDMALNLLDPNLKQ